MRSSAFFPRGKLITALLLAIILAGCDLWSAHPIPATGEIFPTITLAPTDTPIPTVTPIPDRPTDTPAADLSSAGAGFIETLVPAVPPSGTAVTAQGQGQPSPAQPTGTPVSPQAPASPSLAVGRLTGSRLGLIPSRQGLWAMYPDGTHVTLLTTDPILHLFLSPSGWSAAYITSSDRDNFFSKKPFGYTLKIITLYNDRIIPVTSLDPQGMSASSPPTALDGAYQSINAYDHGALAWSPDGETLAFTSMHERHANQPASSDIYLYSLSAGTLNRFTRLQLPQGPGHPFNLAWSPYGRSLYFTVAYSFGNGRGDSIAGAWVNGLDGSSIQVASGDKTSGEGLLAWPLESTVLLYSWNSDCGVQNLRKVNLKTGQNDRVWPNCYQSARYDRLRGEILISVTPDVSGPGGNDPPGLYLVSFNQLQTRVITNQGFSRIFSGSLFGKDSAAWYGYNRGEGLVAIQRNGTIQPLFTGAPFDGSTGLLFTPLMRLPDSSWLWSADGLYLSPPGQSPRQILSVPTGNFTASPAANDLYFFTAPDQDATRVYGIRARDWKPFVLDPRIQDPLEIDWSG